MKYPSYTPRSIKKLINSVDVYARYVKRSTKKMSDDKKEDANKQLAEYEEKIEAHLNYLESTIQKILDINNNYPCLTFTLYYRYHNALEVIKEHRLVKQQNANNEN